MASYKLENNQIVKFICILDRENTPLIFLNFDLEEKELEHQYQIVAALELVEYKISSLPKNEKYIGLLMPLYDDEMDLGAYAYIGSNGNKIIMIKKIGAYDDENEHKKINLILDEIYKKYCILLMNPFYDKSVINDLKKPSNIRKNFITNIENIIKKAVF